MADQGDDSDAVYGVYTGFDGSGAVEEGYPICEKWNSDTSSLSGLGALTQATAYIIVATNFILRTVMIKLVELLGRGNKYSKQALETMISVLLVSFFNLGVLYVIAPWNLEGGEDEGRFF